MITKAKTPAAEYVRMSSGKQERSPAQQRNEIKRLAKSEGCEIVSRFADEAITGDSGPEQRPGFRAMLEAAERGDFQVLLLENGDRLGRFDSLSGAEYYNRLRTAGIRIVTCSDGEIDLTTFEGRVVHTVRQEGRHAFLRDLSRKVVRGQASNAEAGNSNGGPPKYGMDRVLVDASGKIVRRLANGERSSMLGHRVRHVIGEDKAKLDAIRYMFDRFANADIGCKVLAADLEAKGFPTPSGKGWLSSTVSAILHNPIYCGRVLGKIHPGVLPHDHGGRDCLDNQAAQRQSTEAGGRCHPSEQRTGNRHPEAFRPGPAQDRQAVDQEGQAWRFPAKRPDRLRALRPADARRDHPAK